MYSPEIQVKISQWRTKALAGTLTIEEMKEAVRLMRGDRHAALVTSDASKRKKAKKQVKSADELLGELDGMK